MDIAVEKDWDAWERWNSLHGSVFQSCHFAEAIRHSGMDVELLVARENGAITGGCFALLPFRGLLKPFGEYRVVNGPIFSSHDQGEISQWLTILERRARHHSAMCLQLKFPRPDMKSILDQNDYTVAEHGPCYSFHIALTKAEEELWNELDKKTRTAIRKAQKNGVVIRQISSDKDMRIAYRLYMQRAKAKQNWIPYPYSFFSALMQTMPENLTTLIAFYDGKPIAEAMFLHYNKTTYYFNNGSLPNYWNLCANSLLLWEGILIGKKKASTLMDLYGTTDGADKNDSNFSLYQFKAGFGGKLVHTTTFATRCLGPMRKKLWTMLLPIALPLYKAWAGGGLDE